MKYILYAIFALLLLQTVAHAQDRQAIDKDADTMRKYAPPLTEGMVTVRHIILSGNKITRRSILLREMSVKEGQQVPIDSLPGLLNQNKLRLFNLTLFNNVDMHVDKVAANEVDWFVAVKERFPVLPTATVQFADRNFNTWYVDENHDLHRAIFGLTLTDKNFRGDLETLAATIQLGYTQKFALTYTLPYLDRQQKNGIGITAGYARSEQTYYATDSNKLAYAGTYSGPPILEQLEVGVSYIYRPAYASRHIVQLVYKDYKVSDTITKLNKDYYSNGSTRARLIELLYRYECNDVDNWNYPMLGYKLITYAVGRLGIQGLNFQSYANVEAGMFKNPLPKWYYSVIFRGRLMLPQHQPYYFQGGLGTQTDYVRGYEYYVIDGAHYGVLRLDLKRELFNKTYALPIKYFTALPFRIYPKIFADAGYIQSDYPGNSFLSNRMLYSAGVGVDIVTLYDIKVRLEYTRNQLGRNGLYLHLNSE